MHNITAFFFLPLVLLNCGSHPVPDAVAKMKPTLSDEFSKYWYAGKAELTSYRLEQARYGEIRIGSAVTIFVTEDFSKLKHVKLDNPKEAGEDAVSVLKLNLVKKFNTGIYPYSMMFSIFKPVNQRIDKHALKESASSQEWCGHTYTQIDRLKKGFKAHLFSYFESEGEQEKVLPEVWLEDEIWTQIRIDPSGLPIGNISLLQGLLQQRLLHASLDPMEAAAVLDKHPVLPSWIALQQNVWSYTLEYKQDHRKISFYFINSFPFQIQGWEESYLDGFGSNKKLLVSRAVLNKRIRNEYWKHNKNADNTYLDSLGLN
jgi:hypothetical protein